MRVWVEANEDTLAHLASGTALPALDGFAATSEWVMRQEDDDPEVLEDALLYQRTADVVLVVEGPAQAHEPVSGGVSVAPGARLQAIFVRSEPDGDFFWFGPTEVAAAMEALASLGAS